MHATTRLLVRSAIFLASFLLFLSEPIAAKQLLPSFGGSAAVWMTCLVFFQVALLAGYLYAHGMTRGDPSRRLSTLHIALLALAAASAVGWGAGYLHPLQAGGLPVTSIFLSLALSIGLPFVLLASTSPMLQVWLSRTEQDAVSFRLFALSNLASLLALVSYPTLIEPHLTLSLQRQVWALGVAVFALITGVLAWQNRRPASPPAEKLAQEAQPAPAAHKLLWFLLPMAGAMQLSAVTAHLTSNVAAIPLLWVLPLGVYLLTFILAFQFPGLLRVRSVVMRVLAILLASLALLLSKADVSLPIGLAIVFFLLELFTACLFCHMQAYALRPARPAEATLFYLTIAAGGAMGSFLIGIAAPLIFSGNYDLALTFLVTALLALAVIWTPGRSWKTEWPQRLLWSVGSGLLAFLIVALHTVYHAHTLLVRRNFYASLRVTQGVTEHGDPIRTLMNGSIQHGTQIFSDDLRHTPTTYYAPDSGIGLALAQCCGDRPRSIGVIGLGAGTIAAYGRAGDSIRFYEINPSVLPIAQNLFTYTRDSKAKISFAEGDARASLAQESAQGFDVLVVDAFSGDAIPLHLLTVEALALYRHHLAPGGVLAFHVSNSYVDLDAAVAQLALAAGMQARRISSPEDRQSGEFKSVWVLLSADPTFFLRPEVAQRAQTIGGVAGVGPWTDDYSSLLPLVHWMPRQGGR